MNMYHWLTSYKPQAGQRKIPAGGFAYGGWTSPHSDPVSGAAMKKQKNMPFDLLLGRKTFDIWARFWPQHNDVWPGVNTATNYVASNILTSRLTTPHRSSPAMLTPATSFTVRRVVFPNANTTDFCLFS